MKPFVNYIGSKYRFMRKIEHLFPDEITRYFEPFVGGGSVFLHLNKKFDIKQNYINDIDKNIITCYKAIKSDPDVLIEYLRKFDKGKSRRDFEYIVEVFNNGVKLQTLKASMLIYLLKVSFNSRLNYHESDNIIKPNYSKANTKKSIYDAENIREIARLLYKTTITRMDYKAFLDKYKPVKGDFVFFDPPYFVEQVGSYYTESFVNEDYTELLQICNALNEKNVKWMVTVNKHSNLKKLFSGCEAYNIQTFQKYSSISAGKGKEYEMVIRNYM